MNKLFNLFLCFIVIGGLYSCDTKSVPADYNVIPLPANISANEGEAFKLTSSTKIVYPEGNEMMKRNAEFLSDYLKNITGIELKTTTDASDKNAIVLSLGLENTNKEAYRLQIDQKAIQINGASEAGVFYGIQTLRKSTPITEGSISYPSVTIEDQPRFGYRGMMLDVARHFEPVDFVKKYIDLLALHNVNRFHWHLTEDQGWRIEIKKYPKLTEIGSVRSETVKGHNTGKYNGKPHGGFYTQEEIKDIVKYAGERYITVVPEIDLPGHMLAALAAYPEFGCTGGPYEVAKSWGVFDDVLCAGNDSTFTFLEDVLTEVMELFPSEYIHIGGDECPKVRWEKCPKCQAKIKELGLKSDEKHTKEHYLQSYVTDRIGKFLNDHGRKFIGWDEILEGKLAPNATVMSWRGMNGGIQAAQLGHDAIMTPTDFCYFDYYQTGDTDNEPMAIGGFLPLEKVYSFNPIPDELTPEQSTHILGAQANLWTEYIPTPEQVEYMTLPRLAAMSEAQWCAPEKKDYSNFLTRLPRLLDLYEKLGYNFAKHIFDIQAKLTPNIEKGSLDIELSTIDSVPIYYTLDGSEPTKESLLYTDKLDINESTEIKAKAIRGNGKDSKLFSEKVTVNKSTFKPIKLETTISPSYTYGGAVTLVDGLFGGDNYRSGHWLGFPGNDLVAVIDMLKPTAISQVDVRCLVKTSDWIFDAEGLVIESSENGTDFSLIKKDAYSDTNNGDWNELVTHSMSFEPVTAQYFRVSVKSATIPQWHAGKGGKGFVFVDEIVLN